MMSRTTCGGLLATALALLLTCCGGAGSPEDPAVADPMDEILPPIDPGDYVAMTGPAKVEPYEVVDLDRLERILQGFRGKGVLVNFWAMWCAPCVREIPELLEVGREFAPEGRVLGVSYDLMVPGESRATAPRSARAFVDEREWDFDVVIFDGEGYDAINERFGLPGEIPVTLAVDRRGRIVDRQEGAADRERFAEMMRKALGR